MSNVVRRLVRLSAVLAVVSTLMSSPRSDVFAQSNAPVTYSWHVGGVLPNGLDIGMPSTSSPKGDVLVLIGNGTLSLHSKSVTGGGTFTHFGPAGNVAGQGVWQADKLLSFKAYGMSAVPVLPAGSTAGMAHMAVTLNNQVRGVLRIDCQLPDVFSPPAVIEGFRLAVVGGGLNFNMLPVTNLTGGTLFIGQ